MRKQIKVQHRLWVQKNTSNERLVFEARQFFVNGFWQLDPMPPNHMSDKAISRIDKYLKGLCVGLYSYLLICIEPVGDVEPLAIDGLFKRFQIRVSIQQVRVISKEIDLLDLWYLLLGKLCPYTTKKDRNFTKTGSTSHLLQ